MRAVSRGDSLTGWMSLAGRVRDALRGGDRLLLLSDYDGTLTPIVRDPVEAWLAPRVRDDLRRLTESPRVRVAIVSGRRLTDLRFRVRLPKAIYAGCHGLEIEGPGMRFYHSEAEAKREVLSALAHALRNRTATVPGVFVEPKGLAVAVHYRNAAPEMGDRLESLLHQVIRTRSGFRTLRGRKVVEILPTAGWDKGQCALRIREHVLAAGPPGLTTIYLGDDDSDELAFWALAGKALTARIGDGARSLATYHMRGVDDVHRLLSVVAADVQEERPA